jgi:hypothetical protein
MQAVIVLTLVLHVLSGVFWAGSTFTLARIGGAGAKNLLRPQLGCATMVVVTGALLWHLLHTGGTAGRTEYILGVGALAAVAAAAVQGLGLRSARLQTGAAGAEASHSSSGAAVTQRIAAALLAITVICMAASRYV